MFAIVPFTTIVDSPRIVSRRHFYKYPFAIIKKYSYSRYLFYVLNT